MIQFGREGKERLRLFVKCQVVNSKFYSTNIMTNLTFGLCGIQNRRTKGFEYMFVVINKGISFLVLQGLPGSKCNTVKYTAEFLFLMCSAGHLPI